MYKIVKEILISEEEQVKNKVKMAVGKTKTDILVVKTENKICKVCTAIREILRKSTNEIIS